MKHIEQVTLDASESSERCWFVQEVRLIEETANTVTLHLIISTDMFVQIFFSARSERFSLALIGPSGRLYGKDRQFGQWHIHPYTDPSTHLPLITGVSPQPIAQFLAEVERLLLDEGLIDAILP
jgi:hypothetical protein